MIYTVELCVGKGDIDEESRWIESEFEIDVTISGGCRGSRRGPPENWEDQEDPDVDLGVIVCTDTGVEWDSNDFEFLVRWAGEDMEDFNLRDLEPEALEQETEGLRDALGASLAEEGYRRMPARYRQ